MKSISFQIEEVCFKWITRQRKLSGALYENQTKINLITKLTFRKPDTAEGSPLQLSKGFKKDNNLEFWLHTKHRYSCT